MKTLLVELTSLLISASAYGQGTIHFGNRVAGQVDARVLLPDGSGAGAGWTSQLYAGAEGTAVADLIGLQGFTTVLSEGTNGDFNGDGVADLLFENDDGYLAVWFINGAELKSASFLVPNQVRDERWRIVGTGRFNSDAQEDILFQHRESALAVWYLDGIRLVSGTFLDPMEPGSEDWRVVGTGDFCKFGSWTASN